MLWKLVIIIYLTFFLKYGRTDNSRRITFGKRSETDKKFMVYLVKSEKSNVTYDNWMCVGAIVSPTYILTSAACLTDVTYIYAIAGYRRNVRPERLNHDNCTKRWKQKVVKTCVPRRYNFKYHNVTKWFRLDIGFAIVEKPYNFSDVSYRDYCSYVPAPIKINFDPKYTTPGTMGLTYGWGHTVAYRSVEDFQDYNQEYLREGKTNIVDKKICHDRYVELRKEFITNFMICCIGEGLIDSAGNPAEIEPKNDNGHKNRRHVENSRKKRFKNNTTSIKRDHIRSMSRRQGICQNDHGAPLVTWIGSNEYVLGVGSTYIVSSTLSCVGPYMYTSTQCASRFIRCAMNDVSSTRKMCESMGIEEGYELHETEIDWTLTNGNVEVENDLKLSQLSETDKDKMITQGDVHNIQNDTVVSSEDVDSKDFIKWDHTELDSKNKYGAVNDILMIDFKMNSMENKNKEISGGLLTKLTDKLNLGTVTDDVVVI